MKALGIAILLLGTLLSALMFKTLQIHGDNLQMLDKAVLLIQQGQWTHFGNSGTSVGYVPGTFSTAMTALPMMVYFSPYAPMAVILLCQLLAFALIYQVIRTPQRPMLFPLWALLFWLNPWRVEQSELYNPAYLSLFAALHMYTAWLSRERANFWATVFNILAIGFSLQVHYSFLILALASLLLWWFQMVRVHRWGVIAGVGLVVASLLPYIYDYMTTPALEITLARSSDAFLGRNLLYVYPVLKAILYWLRYGSTYLGRHIFSEIRFDWLSEGLVQTLVANAFHVLKVPIAMFTLWLSVRVQWALLKRVWSMRPFQSGVDRAQLNTPRDWLNLYAFYLFVAMVTAAALSPVEFNHWHIILCFPTVVALMTLALADLLERHPAHARWIVSSLIGIFLIHGVLAALGSRVHSYRHDFHRAVLEHYKLAH